MDSSSSFRRRVDGIPPLLVWLLASLLFFQCVTSGHGQVTKVEISVDWEAAVARLLAGGPALVLLERRVEGMAMVRGGAPIVVEFTLEKRGRLVIEVETEDGTESIEIEGGEDERVKHVGFLPAGLGEAFRAGRMVAVAYKERSKKEIGLELHGIAVGEGAMASIAVENFIFAPETIRPARAQGAELELRFLRSFDDGQIDVYRRPKKGRPVLVRTVPIEPSPTRDRGFAASWDGLAKEGKPSKGRHVAIARAWNGRPEEGSWLLGRARGTVVVE